MKKLVVLALTVFVVMSMAACTQQERAKHYGGTAKVELPAGQKLVVATWKEGGNLWYLIRPMRSGESPETYEFIESSSWGVLEGKVVFIEKSNK